MKRINNKGNMIPAVQFFAKQLVGTFAGQKETEFWEASSITEFEKKAVEIGYEIYPTLDNETGRGYLVGFDAEDSEILGPGGQSYSQLKMYFIEISEEELRSWTKKIKHHRQLQQQDYYERQNRVNKKRGIQ